MGSTNYGNQVITFQYQNIGTSKSFNSLLNKIITPGVYSSETETNGVYTYSEGALSVVNGTTASFSPCTVFVSDLENDIALRVKFTSAISIPVSPSSPYIVVHFDWVSQANTYADVVSLPWGSVASDYIIIGRCLFDTGNNLIGFDYSRRMNIDPSTGVSKALVQFRVLAQEAFSNKVTVSPGTISFSTGFKNLSTLTSPSISNTTLGRVDLVCINTSGTITIISGTESSTPVAPSYANNFVVAEIKRIGASSVINGSNIRQINPYRYFNVDSSSPSFSSITISGTPVNPTDGTNKAYVDGLIRGLDWQESVKNFLNFVTSEPTTRNNGDRYVNTASGTSSSTHVSVTANYIYQWNSSLSQWDVSIPDVGTTLLNENTNIQWTYNSSNTWVQFSGTILHNSLGSLQGGNGSTEYYHLTSAQFTNILLKTDSTDNLPQGSTNKYYSDTLVNANAHVTTAYNHSQITSGNPHGTLASMISDFISAVEGDANVSAAYTHSQIITGNPHNTTKSDIGLGSVDNLQQVPLNSKGVANGVASLDSSGFVPASQLPASITSQSLHYSGTWSAAGGSAPSTANKGDGYIVSVAGSYNLSGITSWNVGDWAINDGTNWRKVVGSIADGIGGATRSNFMEVNSLVTSGSFSSTALTKGGILPQSSAITGMPLSSKTWNTLFTQSGSNNHWALTVNVSTDNKAQAYLNLNIGSSWIGWKKIWTEDQMGSGSGLDADMVDSYSPSSSISANSLVLRDANGAISASKTTLNNTSASATTSYVSGANSTYWVGANYASDIFIIGGVGVSFPSSGALNVSGSKLGIFRIPTTYVLEINGSTKIFGADLSLDSGQKINIGTSAYINELSGNIGIGISSPANTLEVGGNIVSNNGTTSLGLYPGSSDTSLGTKTNFPLNIITNNSIAMTIDTSQNIGFGYSTGITNKVSINGAMDISQKFKYFYDSVTDTMDIYHM